MWLILVVGAFYWGGGGDLLRKKLLLMSKKNWNGLGVRVMQDNSLTIWYLSLFQILKTFSLKSLQNRT